jgi:hypothetical protein
MRCIKRQGLVIAISFAYIFRSFFPLFALCNLLEISLGFVSFEIFVLQSSIFRLLILLGARESGHCIALLGESVRAMLFFLEILDLFSSSKHNCSGHIVECAIQCATGLRRVYEEVSVLLAIFERKRCFSDFQFVDVQWIFN